MDGWRGGAKRIEYVTLADANKEIYDESIINIICLFNVFDRKIYVPGYRRKNEIMRNILM